jgi:hypothetical protein
LGAYNVFWGPCALLRSLGPRAETLKQGTKWKTFGVDFLGPRVFWGLRLFGAPLWRTVWGPRWNRKQKIQKKNRREKRGAPKSAGPVAYAASAIWLIRHCRKGIFSYTLRTECAYDFEMLVFNHQYLLASQSVSTNFPCLKGNELLYENTWCIELRYKDFSISNCSFDDACSADNFPKLFDAWEIS